MAPIVKYGVPAVLGTVALSAGLVLAARPLLIEVTTPLIGAVLAIAGATLTFFALLAAFQPGATQRPSRATSKRATKKAAREEAQKTNQPNLSGSRR
jgi:hypothetical protein